MKLRILLSTAVAAAILAACGGSESSPSTTAEARTKNGSLGPSVCVSRQCNVGEFDTGNFLVFNVSTVSGKTTTWESLGSRYPASPWCESTVTSAPGLTNSAIGAGAANSATLANLCKSSAAASYAYYNRLDGTSWQIPTVEEMKVFTSQAVKLGASTAPKLGTTDCFWTSNSNGTMVNGSLTAIAMKSTAAGWAFADTPIGTKCYAQAISMFVAMSSAINFPTRMTTTTTR